MRRKLGRKMAIMLIMIVILLLSVSCDKNNNGQIHETAKKSNEKISTNTDVDYINKKILIIYYSAANLNDVDAVSSATAVGDGDGATGTFAKYIHDRIGGVVDRIIPDEDYPLDYDHILERAKKEKNAREYPGFSLTTNPEDYDIIFVGYPIWSYDMPRVMYTFFARYDFEGKTIIPFNTYGSSLDGGTYDKIRELEPDADVVDGLAIEGKSIDSSKKYVEQWVPEL